MISVDICSECKEDQDFDSRCCEFTLRFYEPSKTSSFITSRHTRPTAAAYTPCGSQRSHPEKNTHHESLGFRQILEQFSSTQKGCRQWLPLSLSRRASWNRSSLRSGVVTSCSHETRVVRTTKTPRRCGASNSLLSKNYQISHAQRVLFFILTLLSLTCCSSAASVQRRSAPAQKALSSSSMTDWCEKYDVECKENSYCVNLRHGYQCKCNQGYEEIDFKCVLPSNKSCGAEDDATYCLHGGKCVMELTFGTAYTKTCVCDPTRNYFGGRCEQIQTSRLSATEQFRPEEIRNAGIVVGIILLAFVVLLSVSGRLRCILRDRTIQEMAEKDGVFYRNSLAELALAEDSYSNNSRYIRSTFQPMFAATLPRSQNPPVSTTAGVPRRQPGPSYELGEVSTGLKEPMTSVFTTTSNPQTQLHPYHIPQTSYTFPIQESRT